MTVTIGNSQESSVGYFVYLVSSEICVTMFSYAFMECVVCTNLTLIQV